MFTQTYFTTIKNPSSIRSKRNMMIRWLNYSLIYNISLLIHPSFYLDFFLPLFFTNKKLQDSSCQILFFLIFKYTSYRFIFRFYIKYIYIFYILFSQHWYSYRILYYPWSVMHEFWKSSSFDLCENIYKFTQVMKRRVVTTIIWKSSSIFNGELFLYEWLINFEACFGKLNK